MLVWLTVRSGLRRGEVSELHGQDVVLIDPEHYGDDVPEDAELVYLNVCRSVSDVGAKRADGGRFLVEDTTKGGRDRRVGLDPLTSTELLDFIDEHAIGQEYLLFPLSRLHPELDPLPHADTIALEPVPVDLSRTAPDKLGRTYAHRTMSGYGPGRFRGPWCRRAIAEYRAKRRAEGLDLKERRPNRKGRNVTDHCPRDCFRRKAWAPAVAAAGIVGRATFHDLRHTRNVARQGRGEHRDPA
jgi:integrase